MNKDVKVFAYKPFKDSISMELYEAIKDKFVSYKTTGEPPSDFGRDTTFDFPAQLKSSGLRHVHIRDKTSIRWNLKKFAFDKTSNTALICRANYFNANYYLLVGLLENAHQVYEDNLLYLLEMSDIADRFSNRSF